MCIILNYSVYYLYGNWATCFRCALAYGYCRWHFTQCRSCDDVPIFCNFEKQ